MKALSSVSRWYCGRSLLARLILSSTLSMLLLSKASGVLARSHSYMYYYILLPEETCLLAANYFSYVPDLIYERCVF